MTINTFDEVNDPDGEISRQRINAVIEWQLDHLDVLNHMEAQTPYESFTTLGPGMTSEKHLRALREEVLAAEDAPYLRKLARKCWNKGPFKDEQ